MPRYLFLLTPIVLVAACSFGSHKAASTPPSESGVVRTTPGPKLGDGPIRFRMTPRWVTEACGGFPAGFRRWCPAAIPKAGTGELTMSVVFAQGRNQLNLMELLSGTENAANESRNRPPRLAGVLVAGGDLGQGLGGLLPKRTAVPPATIRDGLLAAGRRAPLDLGPRRWAGLRGDLSLAPSRGRFPLSYFNYVFFRWRDAGQAHAIGLRAWEPFTETAHVLRKLVRALKPAAPTSFEGRPFPREVDGIAMAQAPTWLLSACRALRTRPICPTRIPKTQRSLLNVFFEPNIVGPGGRQDWLSVEWGIASGDTDNNRPPAFLHLDLRAGAIAINQRFKRAPVKPRDGLFRTRAAGPLPLGHPSWIGMDGTLVLGDCFGNHLCYRWRHGRVAYQIDLHGWEPLTQTVATLRTIVSSVAITPR
jgi:hypothetical protein